MERAASHRRLASSELTPLADAVAAKQDGFQAFAVEDDLKISPKKRGRTGGRSQHRSTGRRRSGFGDARWRRPDGWNTHDQGRRSADGCQFGR